MRVPLIVGLAVLALLATSMLAGAVGATSGTAPVAATDEQIDTAGHDDTEVCFPGDGYDFTIGDGATQIDLIVHLSLFTNLGGAGTLGMEAFGTIDDDDVVVLRTGVLFVGVDDAGAFLSNPFESFGIAYEYRLRLPMFDVPGQDPMVYETSDAPVDGPVSDVDCG